MNLSAAPVKRRIDRLEQLGVITGYTVSLDHALIGPSIEAFTELRFAGDADIDEILAAVERIPEIREVFTMAGDPDALLRIRVNDVEHLKAVVNHLRRTGPCDRHQDADGARSLGSTPDRELTAIVG